MHKHFFRGAKPCVAEKPLAALLVFDTSIDPKGGTPPGAELASAEGLEKSLATSVETATGVCSLVWITTWMVRQGH